MAGLTKEERAGVLVVHFGDTELNEESRVREIGSELAALASDASGKRMLISFDGVLFMSSSMFGQLVLLKKVCDANDVALRLCDVGEELGVIFTTLQLGTLIEICGDLSSALASFQSETQGERVETPPELFESYRAAAEQGDASSQYALAKCYEEGRGVEQDFAEAFEWCKKAADQGHVDAQYMMGTCYAFGMHVTQDYGEAVTWHEKAARQGHPDAQYIIGLSYHHGLAGTEDHEAAAQWYRQAAAQGHKAAQEAIAALESGQDA